MSGNLYIVATPIGNLEDITLRAIQTLKNVDMIAAEDTRHTLKLLNHLGITKPLMSYYKEKEKSKAPMLISKLKEGKNIALVSDAGTPVISDPGEEVVKEAVKNHIKVIPIPGPCAFVNALVCSGMETKEFSFVGFLPTNRKEKIEKLKSFLYDTKTVIFYEAPHKLRVTLEEIQNVLGNRKMTLARELTKIHEEFIVGTAEELLEILKDPKGEFVLILEGAKINEKEKQTMDLNEKSLEEHFAYYKELGFDKKEIIKKIAKDRKVSKNEIYQYFIK